MKFYSFLSLLLFYTVHSSDAELDITELDITELDLEEDIRELFKSFNDKQFSTLDPDQLEPSDTQPSAEEIPPKKKRYGKCPICQTGYKRGTLYTHLEENHPEKDLKDLEELKIFTCKPCKFATPSSKVLKTHSETHTHKCISLQSISPLPPSHSEQSPAPQQPTSPPIEYLPALESSSYPPPAEEPPLPEQQTQQRRPVQLLSPPGHYYIQPVIPFFFPHYYYPILPQPMPAAPAEEQAHSSPPAQKKDPLKRKRELSDTSDLFKCQECGNEFEKVSLFMAHLEVSHPGKKRDRKKMKKNEDPPYYTK